MLYADETVTFARCSGTAWTTETVTGCSWYEKTITTMGDRGLQMAKEIKVRVPDKLVPAQFPAVGDYIIRGNAPSTLTKIGDLDGYVYAKITIVGDNRRGMIPHLAVVAK